MVRYKGSFLSGLLSGLSLSGFFPRCWLNVPDCARQAKKSYDRQAYDRKPYDRNSYGRTNATTQCLLAQAFLTNQVGRGTEQQKRKQVQRQAKQTKGGSWRLCGQAREADESYEKSGPNQATGPNDVANRKRYHVADEKYESRATMVEATRAPAKPQVVTKSARERFVQSSSPCY